jgi:hypothetical protein
LQPAMHACQRELLGGPDRPAANGGTLSAVCNTANTDCAGAAHSALPNPKSKTTVHLKICKKMVEALCLSCRMGPRGAASGRAIGAIDNS